MALAPIRFSLFVPVSSCDPFMGPSRPLAWRRRRKSSGMVPGALTVREGEVWE